MLAVANDSMPQKVDVLVPAVDTARPPVIGKDKEVSLAAICSERRTALAQPRQALLLPQSERSGQMWHIEHNKARVRTSPVRRDERAAIEHARYEALRTIFGPPLAPLEDVLSRGRVPWHATTQAANRTADVSRAPTILPSSRHGVHAGCVEVHPERRRVAREELAELSQCCPVRDRINLLDHLRQAALATEVIVGWQRRRRWRRRQLLL